MYLLISLFGVLAVMQQQLEAAYIPDSDRNTKTLQNDLQVERDGNYRYAYETSNGISASQGGLGGVSVQGGSSYTSPEGSVISVSYVADETGYHPVGDHIPKVPDYILRALEYIRTHPYQVKDYYTGELKPVAHDAAAFNVYSRNIHEQTTPRSRPSATPKTIYLTHPPTIQPLRQRQSASRRR
ncbi:pupal cuticle protein [Drosophila subobscura]|uniref:pupal cuticle protein n=1 Tax=Drosophila subobscura TaxID=7241 RepID=UPI00155A7BF0|nr:pupal cuticle protein [Drosophila subobscura]